MTEIAQGPTTSKRGIGVWVALVILMAGGVAFGLRIHEASRDREAQSAASVAAPAPLVSVEAPSMREMVDSVTLTGTIRPASEVDVFARQPGRLERVLVKLGDRVKAGQLLAVVEHREVEWQARQADAQVMVADANVELAQNNLEAMAKTLDRVRGLMKEGAATGADLERAELSVKAAQTSVKLASAQRELSKAQAGLAGTAFDNSRVTSPIDGVIVSRLATLGGQASPAAPLFRIQDTSLLKLEGAVSASEFMQLRVGQKASVRLDEVGGDPVVGKVTTLSATLDAATRRAFVEVTVANDQGRLMANMFGRARIETAPPEAVLSVVEQAIITDAQGPMLYVLRNGKAEQVRPRVSGNDGRFVAVREGLTDQDMVIVSGQAGLTPGTVVRVANKAGDGK